MSNVVQLRPKQKAMASPAFDEAWTALPVEARTRSSRKEAYPAWVKAASDVGEEALLRAVRRYVREDKDHKRECGAPGFHRWLRWGRYEHWIETPQLTVVSDTPRFDREDVRQAVILAKGEGFCGAYLDRARSDGSRIVVATETAAIKLREVGQIMKAFGYTGMVVERKSAL